MTLDLDALEAQFNFAVLPMTGDDPVVTRRQHDAMESFRNSLPELIRLARIGQRVERDARPGPSQECVRVPMEPTEKMRDAVRMIVDEIPPYIGLTGNALNEQIWKAVKVVLAAAKEE